MKVWLFLGLLINLAAQFCFAQCTGPSCPLPTVPPVSAPALTPEIQAAYTKIQNASVKVYAIEQTLAGRTVVSRGSGTVVKYKDYVVILTAGHVISSSNTYIEHSQWGRIPCQVWGLDKYTDFAVLEPTTKQEELYECGVPIVMNRVLQANETVLLAGFDATPNLSIWQSRVKSWLSSRSSAYADWMELNGRARQGDSGGGVFTTQGDLAGIIWGTRMEETSDVAYFSILFFTEDGRYVDRISDVHYMRWVPRGQRNSGGSVFATWIQPIHEELRKVCFQFRWRKPIRRPPPPIESVPPHETPQVKPLPSSPSPESKEPPKAEAPAPMKPPVNASPQIPWWKEWFEFFKPTLWVTLGFIIYWCTLIVADLIILLKRTFMS